jgi:hypothetical protein
MANKKKSILFNGIAFVVILLVLNLTDSFCDVGNCVRYKVELHTNDNAQLIGFIQIFSYEPMVEMGDLHFFDYLKKYLAKKNQDTFTLYENIQTIEYPKLEFQTYGFKYSAASKRGIVEVNIEKIKSIHLRDLGPCEHGDFSTIKRSSPKDSFLINYFHWIIEELTQPEIDMLQTKPELLISRESPLSSHEWDRLFVLCYDKSITESELNQLCSGLYLNAIDDEITQEEFLQRKTEHYHAIKNDLKRKKIVTLIVKGYN